MNHISFILSYRTTKGAFNSRCTNKNISHGQYFRLLLLQCWNLSCTPDRSYNPFSFMVLMCDFQMYFHFTLLHLDNMYYCVLNVRDRTIIITPVCDIHKPDINFRQSENARLGDIMYSESFFSLEADNKVVLSFLN